MIQTKQWKNWTVGEKILYHYKDFDGCGIKFGTVSDVSNERAIVSVDGENLWVDDDTEGMFRITK